MILENKFIREKRQKKRLMTTILITFFLICFGLLVVLTNTKQEMLMESTDHITFAGMLVSDTNYPSYTHTITSGDTRFHAKSSTINLNTFAGKNLRIRGEIVDASSEIPTVDINMIYTPEQSYFLKDKKYIFPKKFFLLDLSQDTMLSLDLEGKTQVLYDRSPAFGVSAFVCNKIIPDQDCKTIKDKLIKKYVKTFTSPLGYQFYQDTDDKWYVFGEGLPMAWVFSAPDEEVLVNLSYIFQPLDGKFFTTQKQTVIESSCLETTEALTKISKITQQNIKGSTYLKLILEGTKQGTQEGKIGENKKSSGSAPEQFSCDILIDLLDINLRTK